MTGLLPPSVTLTQQIYLDSLDPTRRALIDQQYHALVDQATTEYNPTLAKQLLNAALASGFPIDYQIMIWGWDAASVMSNRYVDGYAYVPAYGQPNINIAPGLSMPGVPSNYQGTIPQGSIKVSIDAKDYPKWVDPSGPPIPTAGITVGPLEFSGVGPDNMFHYYFGVVSGDHSRIGTNVTYNGQNFTKVQYLSQFMIGAGTPMILWQLNLS